MSTNSQRVMVASLAIRGHGGVEHVLALEGRADNLARARYVQRAYDVATVEFRQANLELDPAELGRFDAVFCAGLLHHLPERRAGRRRRKPRRPVRSANTRI